MISDFKKMLSAQLAVLTKKHHQILGIIKYKAYQLYNLGSLSILIRFMKD